MKRFDPVTARSFIVASPAWVDGDPARRDNGSGERSIGDLVRAIVERLEQGSRLAGAKP